jgi:hypothetical protein
MQAAPGLVRRAPALGGRALDPGFPPTPVRGSSEESRTTWSMFLSFHTDLTTATTTNENENNNGVDTSSHYNYVRRVRFW